MTSAVAVAVFLTLAGLLAREVGRVRRLHRLHVRVDGARAGLDAALRARAGVAREIARLPPSEPAGPPQPALARAVPGPARPRGRARPANARGPSRTAVLAAAASAALAARDVDGAREGVENTLGRHLAGVDRAALPAPLRTALAEAERAVELARSVHNDAVRDTLDLRSRRLVRWFRLAGAAPLPAYFEIAVIPAAAGRGAPGPDVRSDDRPS
ncbi:NUDIX hydrolase [Pseudonocardia hydrocarbonoxydans]|uniref:NUDIX hydrolase n=1 Tax=Pseudonocardia hydrocarbonoxydans TaxID=76726 RepID=UPI0031D1A778